jgi:hypothetical protein
MAEMPVAVAPVAQIYKINNVMVERTLEGLSEDELWQRPAGGNPIAWLIGHLAETRGSLMSRIGAPWHPGWGAKFSRGSMVGDRSAYPSPAEITAAWKATPRLMRDVFAQLTEARLGEPPSGPAFPGVNTISDQIAFLAFHEAYHVGQMAYVRKAIGRSAIAG